MGEVFEAEDLELGERVAIKRIRLDHVHDDDAVERFRREIHLARKITHPNVCRVYDVFRHQTGDETTVFLSMELLEGTTLSDHLLRHRPVALDQALAIGHQLADGLDAIHTRGVVHRDLKPANVMLVDDPATSSGRRAVITDFGLARRSMVSETTQFASREGAIIGTPAYMAPEQVEGGLIGPAADVYAFGTILYELVTGRLPFTGETPVAMAVRRLTEEPLNPRTLAPSLPVAWERTILECLRRQPADRPRSARAAMAMLVSPNEPPRNKTRVALRVAGVALAIAAVGGVLTSELSLPRLDAPRVAAPASRRSIAVLGFRNQRGRVDAPWIETAFVEGVSAALASSEHLRVITSESVPPAVVTPLIEAAAARSVTQLRTLADSVGADLVLTGVYEPAAEANAAATFRLQVLDARTGADLVSASQSATLDRLSPMLDALAAAVSSQLGIATQVRTSMPSALPANAEALRLYAEGLKALRNLDAPTARDKLLWVAQLEPRFARGHVALASAWAALGDDRRALESAGEAFRLVESAPALAKLEIQARYYEAAKDWTKAVASYKELLARHPDQIDYALKLASLQESAGMAREALQVIATARRLPSPTRDDPRLDLAEASVAGLMGEFQQQLEAAERAVVKGRERQTPLLVARSLIERAWALAQLGKADAAREANDESLRLFRQAKDARGAARALIQLGELDTRARRLTEARAKFSEAIELTASVNNERHLARALIGLGNVTFRQGDLDEAASIYERAREMNERIGDRRATAVVYSNLASIAYQRGDIERALQLDRQSLAIKQEIGDRAGQAFSLTAIAETATDLGQLSVASQAFEEAIRINTEIRNRAELAYARLGLAVVRLHQADLGEARSQNSAAAEIWASLSDEEGVIQTTVLSAVIDSEEGQLAGREPDNQILTRLNDVRKRAAEAKLNALEASARVAQGRWLLAANRTRAAAEAIQGAPGLLGANASYSVRFGVELAQIDLALAQRRWNQATQLIDRALAEATRSRLSLYQSEISLRQASLLLATGQEARARTELSELEARTRAADQELIRLKAARLGAGFSSGPATR
jgi:tetratricopeptide (TPR) repeat protein/tRNA A-37 threonylcarbamoyl transferase component Bud32